jgi:hypothetical protein
MLSAFEDEPDYWIMSHCGTPRLFSDVEDPWTKRPNYEHGRAWQGAGVSGHQHQVKAT